MTEKNTKTQGLKTDPKRQAHNQLRGYLYQIWHSVNAWLDLTENEILYLEGAEDFDIVSDATATTVQVKDTQRNITLRSQEVNDAIKHYWELRTNHSDLTVKFRFLTRSKIGKEQGDPFGNDQPGLRLWNRCSGDEETITKISEFLRTQEKISDEVKIFLKQAELQKIYEQLIEPIAWETDSKPASFVEQSINKKLVLHGNQLGFLPAESKKVVDLLINEAWRVATQKENRVLTKVRFLEIFGEQITQSVSPQYLRHLQMQATMVNPIGATFIESSSDITIQSHPHIQTDIPPLYLDAVVPRSDLLTSIQTKLQSEGIVVIQGGVNKGKTTLAKLTANAIDGDWYWLNFTEIDPSSRDLAFQVVQQLKQLAILISNQSSQANVVLDNLNLQPQHLQMYEDDLGVVVYRILERDAKLLITSRHEPPNNLIRRLGVSSSVTINVPNFTESEIEQFAEEMGCPTNDVKNWATLIQAHTGGHPRLVDARLTRLREKDWKLDINEDILQTPPEVVEEREAARQLLTDLPEDQRELLYRLSLVLTFRKDYALNIGEIPKPIPHPGDILSQLVDPWIDQVNETYYTISPLLADAAKQVWSKSKLNKLHAQIADAILKTNNLTTIEARAVFSHSMLGQNKMGLIAVIQSLIVAPENNWKELSREFSWLIAAKTNPPEELFPGDASANYRFRSLQYRIAIEVNPEFAPKILELWDKETKPYKPHQSYLLDRLMLATGALIYYPVSLPVKQMVGYLKEIIDITDNDKEVQKIYYDNFTGQLEEHKTDKVNFFSILFSFIWARPPFDTPFLSDLIDALDELQPKIRTLLLADFESDSINSRLLIDSVWLAEADFENPDWTRCLQVFDKVIEKTIAWGYPHIAAASARGKAIIHDEYLHTPDTAHNVLQDIISKVGLSPAIEEAQAVVYLHQKHYKEALNIYERILPKWNPPSEQLNVGPLEEYRRAAICATYLEDWEKAATFFETGATRTQKIENTERYIGLYADAGFAQFKAGNMSDSIKLLNLALQKFGLLPQDNTDVKYFTLKKRLEYVTGWMASYDSENNSSEHEEPPAGLCSNPETNEEQVLTLPDSPMGYAWLNLAQIEYKFALGMTAFQQALQIIDRETYPILSSFLSLLETQYDFRNKTFDDLPQRIHQLANAFGSIQKSGKGKEKGTDTISIANLSNFASVENIIFILVIALLVRLPTRTDMHEILAIWRTNSSELSIKENIINALNLIESMLFGDENNARTVMRTPEANEKRLVAALKVVHNKETSLENLFDAHKFIATSLIGSPWEDFVAVGLAELLSAQWLEKINSGAMLQMNVDTIRQIEQACNSSETGKKKIGQILLAAYPVVLTIVAPEILQKFHSWSEDLQES